jgi:type I restriction enzyme, S subunit
MILAQVDKAFSGELVPTEAELARAEGRTYETAEELLARVRQADTEQIGERGRTRAPARSGRRAAAAPAV